MNRFNLRDPESAESELDLWIRDQRSIGSSDTQILETLALSMADVVEKCRDEFTPSEIHEFK